MRIGIDARLINYRRGIGNYVYHTVQMLAKLSSRFEYILYISHHSARQFIPQAPTLTVKILQPNLYALSEQVSLPIAVKRDEIDLLFCPANTAPLALNKRLPVVLTIHDVMYLLPKSALLESTSLYQRLGRTYRRWIVPQAVKLASEIITVSNYSRIDIIHNTTVDANKIHVIYEAPGPLFGQIKTELIYSVMQKYQIGKNYIVALAAIDPRKNTHLIIQAFAQFLQRANTDYSLVLVGLNDREKAYFLDYSKAWNIDSRIKTLGFVTEEELIALYNGAIFFLYPSLYEGFGLPILEAMACGTPVISSNRTSIPEIAGNAAHLIDPTDVDALIEAMLQFADNEARRQQYMRKGLTQVSEFTWESSTTKLLDIFNGILK